MINDHSHVWLWSEMRKHVEDKWKILTSNPSAISDSIFRKAIRKLIVEGIGRKCGCLISTTFRVSAGIFGESDDGDYDEKTRKDLEEMRSSLIKMNQF
ncbi:MAG: hypothetical protein Ta2E_09880 [Mycoplasmoidaceae bacterium]|nr:MAG: hypothetical protein Ta2E_09880 [Mycoplasmoidaceae bacterium]